MLPVEHSPRPEASRPAEWLGSSPLLDLEDPKLRLRVRALTQLCSCDRDKAVALHHFVKRFPVIKPFRVRLHTAREVLAAGRGDAVEKATLLVAMLRAAGIPSRMRWIRFARPMFAGLAPTLREVDRALVEVWIDGGWQRTDTFIYDADLMAAARQRLRDAGQEWGYGIHVAGSMLWDGQGDAFMGGPADAANPMFVQDLGCFHDPLEFVASAACRREGALTRVLRANLRAPFIDRCWRQLRDQLPPPGSKLTRKTS